MGGMYAKTPTVYQLEATECGCGLSPVDDPCVFTESIFRWNSFGSRPVFPGMDAAPEISCGRQKNMAWNVMATERSRMHSGHRKCPVSFTGILIILWCLRALREGMPISMIRLWEDGS